MQEKSISDFIRALDAIGDDSYPVARIEAAAQGVDASSAKFDAAIPAIFALFERRPAEELGSPCILVHLLEARGSAYEEELIRSLSRQPSFVALELVNRILNGSLSPEARRHWLDAFKAAARHPGAIVSIRREAREYLKHQRDDDREDTP